MTDKKNMFEFQTFQASERAKIDFAMSPEEKKQYLANNGRKCPVCNGFVVATTAPEISECGYATVKFYSQCFECGRCWRDVYKLDDVEQVKE